MIMETKESSLDWSLLSDGAAQLGITLSERQISQFSRYYTHLIKVNEVMNLTAITSFRDVVIKHFIDSLSLVKAVDPHKINTLLDLGTGAGFPGVPLKIAFPHLKVTLADSLQKRLRFLEEVIALCELEDIDTVHGRAEELARQECYREKFDLCVSRAVANLSTLSEYCLPFVRIGGSFIAYKTDRSEEEQKAAEKAIHILGGKKEKTVDFILPACDLGRSLVVIKKKTPTPGRYPRKSGTPAKTPL